MKIKELFGIKKEDNEELSTEEIADKLSNLTTTDCTKLNDKKSANKQKVKVKINTNVSSNVNPTIKITTTNTNSNSNSDSDLIPNINSNTISNSNNKIFSLLKNKILI